MYYESTLVQVVQKVVVHKQFFRQSHCFTYIVALPDSLARQPCPAALPGSLAHGLAGASLAVTARR
jgi:hypothetical protein